MALQSFVFPLLPPCMCKHGYIATAHLSLENIKRSLCVCHVSIDIDTPPPPPPAPLYGHIEAIGTGCVKFFFLNLHRPNGSEKVIFF